MFANIVLCCALAFWIGAGLLWLGRHTCRTFKGGLLRRSGPGTRIAMLVMALYSLYVGGSKRGSVTVSDDYIADAGSYLTNDVAHVAISKKTPILPDDTEILVYARELSSSNVADWVRLEPHLTFEDHPYDYTLVNATNYNVMVAASYTPAPTVHTNGVWVLKGFEIPGWNSHYSFGNSRVRTIVTASAYVQDGLIAMWDGIENAGWGVHDPSAPVWKDLVGNLDLQGVISSDLYFTDNALHAANGKYFEGDLSQVPTGLSNITFEACWNRLDKFNTSADSNQTIGQLVIDVFGNRFWFKTAEAQNGYMQDVSGRAKEGEPFVQTMTGVYGGSLDSISAWINGSPFALTTPYGSAPRINRVRVGSGWNNPTSEHHNIRVYSRVLSAEEIRHNYEIDRIRFNLP